VSKKPSRGEREKSSFIVELHGDVLYSWFKEKFPKHPDALTREECRAFVGQAVRDARASKGGGK
jgi:hypothetical protein